MAPQFKRTTLREFKRVASSLESSEGGGLADILVPKQASIDIDLKALHEDEEEEEEEENRIVPFVISTSDVDRENDTIAVDGWELDHFRRSGVVLWGHNADMPAIAEPFNTRVVDNQLRSHARFMPKGVFDFADLILSLIHEGIIKGASVGFRPIEWVFNTERGGLAVDFKRQELLEWSVVNIAANAAALARAASKGLDMALLYEWTERALDNTKTLLVPRGEVEAVRDALKPIVKSSGSATKTVITWATAHPDGTPAQAVETAWDGPGEIAASEISDLLVMASWRESKSRDDLIKSDFKLPHHVSGGTHAVNWRGTIAAMGALLGARGGVDIPDADRRGVYNHLARHYRDDFERDPPEFRVYEPEELKALFESADLAPVNVTGAHEAQLRAARDNIDAILSDLDTDEERTELLAENKRLRVRVAELEDQHTPEPDTPDDTFDEKEIAALISQRIDDEIARTTGRLPS